MDNEELIKQIEELKKQNQALVSANANLLSTIEESNKKNNELEIELQKAMEKNRQLSVELNQVLLKLAAITEKDKIMQARMFVPKTETQDSILINETEDIIKKEKKTTLLVTHDISEALSTADRIVVLSKRPSKVLNIHIIDLDKTVSPLKRREDPRFSRWFERLWRELNHD